MRRRVNMYHYWAVVIFKFEPYMCHRQRMVHVGMTLRCGIEIRTLDWQAWARNGRCRELRLDKNSMLQ
jgi:hypothetical protein